MPQPESRDTGHKQLVSTCIGKVLAAEEHLEEVRSLLLKLLGTTPLQEPEPPALLQVLQASLGDAAKPESGQLEHVSFESSKSVNDVGCVGDNTQTMSFATRARIFNGLHAQQTGQPCLGNFTQSGGQPATNDALNQSIGSGPFPHSGTDSAIMNNRWSRRAVSTHQEHEQRARASMSMIWVSMDNGWKIPVLGPHCKTRLIWMLLGFFFITYELFAVPVYISFDISPTPDVSRALFVLVTCLNAYFFADIPVNFMSGYYDSDGHVVVEPGLIAKSYIGGGLFIDVIACVPWEWLRVESSGVTVLRLLKLSRLLRFLHLIKFKNYFDSFQGVIEESSVLTFVSGVVKVLSMLFAIAHWSACLWYSFSYESLDATISGNLSEELSVPQRYVYCLYFSWTTMTTVGYGDITPSNFKEICFVLVLLFVSSITFAYLMGSLTDIVSTVNSRSRALAERRTQLSRYLHWRDVPGDLLKRIKQHLVFLWVTNEGYDNYEVEIKRELSPGLKTELCFHIYGRVVMTAPWLCWMRDYHACVKDLCNLISSLFLDAGDTLVYVGQRNDAVYTLIAGSVWLSRNLQLIDSDFRGYQGCPLSIPRKRASHFVLEDRMTKLASHVSKGFARTPTNSENTTSLRPRRSREYNVDTEVLLLAERQLRREDLRAKSAARIVQRVWRQTQPNRKLRSLASWTSPERLGHSMISKEIAAPAYFGESCLWVPVSMWMEKDKPSVYPYTLSCVARCELVKIPREAILEVLTRFSPWLPERFESYRQAVVGISEGNAGLEVHVDEDAAIQDPMSKR